MTSVMKFGLSPGSNVEEFAAWFESCFEDCLVCAQDTVHIGTKLRNRLLNSAIILYMGSEIVSIVHIQMLLKKSSKEVHGLIWSDILPEDRQNFSSLEKLMHPRVIDALEKNVADCKGTIMYLNLCKQITSSYLDDTLEPVERIYRIWHATYFLRCWRQWIQSKEIEHTLAENFVSRSSFLCTEINAHAMIYLIRKLRDSQKANLFIPSMFASQPCEFVFRQMRSMGTANFTKINFTLFELLHMNSRVELSNKIIHLHDELKFPRVERKRLQGMKNTVLPSDQQIFDAMIRARQDALQNAANFGMNPGEEAITNFDTSLLTGLRRQKKTNADLNSEADSDEDLSYDDVHVFENLFDIESDTSFPNTDAIPVANLTALARESGSGQASSSETRADPGVNPAENRAELARESDSGQVSSSITVTDPGVDEKRNFVEVIHPDGTKTNIRKSTLVWKLSESSGKLSSDRLKRVQGTSNAEPKRKKQKTTNASNLPNEADSILFKATEAVVGEWAIFKRNDQSVMDRQNPKQFLLENCLFGHIFGFKNIGPKGRTIQHKKYVAKTPYDEESPLNLQILGAWYTCNESGNLTPLENKKNIEVSMKNYIATIKMPINTQDGKSENLKLSYAIPCGFSELITLLLDLLSA